MTTLGESPEFREFMEKHVTKDLNGEMLFRPKIDKPETERQIGVQLLEIMYLLSKPRYENWVRIMLKMCAYNGMSLSEIERWLGKSTHWIRDRCKEHGIKLLDGRSG